MDEVEKRSRDAIPDKAKEVCTEKTASAMGVEPASSTACEPETTPNPGPSYPRAGRQVILVTALMLVMFIVALDGNIIATAIPTITSQFHSTSDVGWYGSAYFIGLSTFQGFWGKAYKDFGQKSTILSCILIFELGSLVVALAPNSISVIAGRAVQGLGGSGLTSGSYLIMAFIVPVHRLSLVMGLFGAVWACSSIVGPLLGGVLTEVSWRWCFWINLPIGGVAFLALLIFFRTPDHAKFGTASSGTWKTWLRTFDVLGIVLALAAWVCLLLVLQEGGTVRPWSSSLSIGLLVGFCLFVIAFVAAEVVQGDTAGMVPMRLLRDRTIAACALYNFLSSSGMLVRTYTLPIYFQAVQGATPSTSGIRTLPSVLATSIAAFISAAALGKIGYYLAFLWIGGIFNTVGSGIYYLLRPTSSAGEWIGYQIVVGVGAGIVIQIPVMVAQRVSAPKDMSVTVALMMFTQFVGGGIGISAGEAILNNQLPANVLATGATGLRKAFPPQDLVAVMNSYMTGLRGAWIFSTTMIGVSLLVLFAAEWRSIKKGPSSTTSS